MRIGIMLRAIDEQGGIGVYTRNIVEELLKIDSHNEYALFYRQQANLGRFADHDNVSEHWIRGGNKALWDQVAIPLACRQQGVDVVFHPKFTVPILAPCRAVMVVHGADWFIPEQAQFYDPLDVRYIRTVMPLYFRKASAVISVSELTTENFNRALDLPPDKIHTVYFAPARHFRPVEDRAILQAVKARYDLPDQFILTLTKVGGDERKNFANIVTAYEMYHQGVEVPHKLVVGGKDCERLRATHRIPGDGYGRDVLFPGWIDQADLPAVYSLASVFLYPSNQEAFPIPVTEAMACGTPIITSKANGLQEIAGDAALFTDPSNSEEIAEALHRLLAEAELRSELSRQGLARSQIFSWDRCARETLEILVQVPQRRGD